jgi:hypothetical protein
MLQVVTRLLASYLGRANPVKVNDEHTEDPSRRGGPGTVR